jgi:catechol 2,3-dioxygenase-like lactoylglutathione lyase family enzyme
VVRDVDASVAFYSRLGVPFPPVPPGWEVWAGHHRNAEPGNGADVDLDSPWSAGIWNAGWPDGATGAVLNFRVPTREAVDRLHGELVAAGHRSLQEPYDAFFGARFAVVEDPDGNHVGLMSPLDDAMRSAPPDPPS